MGIPSVTESSAGANEQPMEDNAELTHAAARTVNAA